MHRLDSAAPQSTKARGGWPCFGFKLHFAGRTGPQIGLKHFRISEALEISMNGTGYRAVR